MKMKTEELIYKARHEFLGLSQEELSEKLQCSSKSVSRWECGTVEVPFRVMRELIELCDEEGIDLRPFL